MRHEFNVVQEFHCTYAVEGDTPEEAWEALLEGQGQPVGERVPGDLLTTFAEAAGTRPRMTPRTIIDRTPGLILALFCLMWSGAFVAAAATDGNPDGGVTFSAVLAGALIPGALAAIPARIAAEKGRDFFTWWVYGCGLLVVAFIHALMLPAPDASK